MPLIRLIPGIFLALILSISACKPRLSPTEINLKEALIGEWRNVSLHVTHPTHKGSDSTHIIIVEKGKWVEKMQMAPIRTHYKKDGTYFSEYRTVADSLFFLSEGTWDVENDSLMMTIGPKKTRVMYKVELDGKEAKITSRLDFDADGQADDLYVGVQKKYE